MEESNQLIKNTKKKFLIYSLIGISLVGLVSYFALRLHGQNVEKQASIQKMYSLVTNQLNLINQISALSEKFDNNDDDEVISTEINKEFKQHLKDLNSENQILNQLLKENNIISIKNIGDILEDHQTNNKLHLFVKRASELVEDKTLTNLEVKKNVRFLADSSRDGIGDVLSVIGKKLAKEQNSSLNILNRMGFILVGLCILQVILVWLLVFKPLYNTILTQHEKISESILRAESANRSKTDFLANISHEIRTPMTGILGYSDILKRDNISKEDRDDAVKIIDQNANHLLALIDEILDISKIEAGKFDFENEEVDLSAFLNEFYSLINVKFEDKGIDLIFKNRGKIPETIMTDPKRLKQILFNILGNAIKFTDKGFVELTVSYIKESNLLSLKIKDTGIGISPEQKKKLFKPFEQGDSSVGRKFGGTGLGLVLTKGLARGMGGDIKILESKVGVGTTMEVLVNIGKPEELELVSSFSTSVIEDKPESIDRAALDGVKILVVDDAKENARLFKLYLAEAGAEVEIANDGESALSKASSSFYDIVLLDLQMPGKDGFQVIKELRDKSFEKPVVALTAHAMKEEKEKTKKAGFNDHITKPVKPNDLIQAVSELIHSEPIRVS